jgi:uncharacterized membrane protein YkgB
LAVRQDIDIEERAKERLPDRIREPVERFDRRLTRWLDSWGITLLRIALGVVYIWFGALKVVDRSPIEDLLLDVAFFTDGKWIIYVFGAWEIVIGLGLIFPVALRITLLMLWVQLAGTLLAFVFAADKTFQDGNPLLLTETGEFVLKNLVLITAGLVIGSTVRARNRPVERDDSARLDRSLRAQ